MRPLAPATPRSYSTVAVPFKITSTSPLRDRTITGFDARQEISYCTESDVPFCGALRHRLLQSVVLAAYSAAVRGRFRVHV
jgi:hypothetical protein